MRLRRGSSVGIPAILAIAGLLAGSSTGLAGTVVHEVPGDFSTIQAAINGASDGDVVRVSAGTYSENLTLSGKNLVVESVDGAMSTTIDGGDSGTVFLFDGATITRSTVLEGFTIQNGLGTLASEGGGISIRGGASPTIRNNRILDNRSNLSGGGLKVSGGGDPLIEGNVVQNNSSSVNGGGIHVDSATATIRENTFRTNTVDPTATSSGGGVKVNFSTAPVIISDNVIEMNTVTFAGGGISVVYGDAEVTSNTIFANLGGRFAGGVHFETNDANGPRDFLLQGNVIQSNEATDLGGGLHTFFQNTTSSLEVLDNQFLDNTCVTSCTDHADPSCCRGGGLACNRGSGAVEQIFRGNVLAGNRADTYGAGILDGGATGMSVLFESNTVEDNASVYLHPGLACVNAVSCRIRRNVFRANEGENYPAGSQNVGAFFTKDTTAVEIENNFFVQNVGDWAGAVQLGRDVLGTTPIRNNTFYDNTTLNLTNVRGGTLRLQSDASVDNNVFFGDVRGLRIQSTVSTLQIRNNDFNGFSTGVTDDQYTHLTVASLNGESFASGNVDLAPGLVDPATTHRLRGDSQLLGLALCPPNAPLDDLDGDMRPVGGGCEIGADELVSEIFSDGFESGNTSAWSTTG